MDRVRLGLSTPTFVRTVDEFLERTARDGWDFAEFNHLDLHPFSPEMLDEGDRRRARALAADLGLELTLHSGDWDLLTYNPSFLQYSIDRSRQEAELARDLEAAYLTSHFGRVEHFHVPPRGRIYADETFDFEPKVRAAVSHLGRLSEELDVRILFENTDRLFDHMIEAINRCEWSGLGFTLDIGHANIYGGVRELHRVMSERGRLLAMHVHDNRGDRDAHLPLGAGTVDIEGLEVPPYVAVEVRDWQKAVATREAFRQRYL